MLLKRIYTLLRRRARAPKFGFHFTRSAAWNVPKTVVFKGKEQKLHLPDDMGSKTAAMELFLDDCYGLENPSFIQGEIKTILDIGAHAGLFSLLARIHYPSALIHAYEPNPAMAPFIRAQSELGSFTYYPEAVGEKEGRVHLTVDQRDSVLTTTQTDSHGNVRQIAFRECLARLGGKVDLLKMDCEGAEWDLFKDKEVWKNVKYITMEYHMHLNRPENQTIEDALQGLGFRILKKESMGPLVGLAWAARNG